MTYCGAIRRALRSQDIFLNFAGRSFRHFFDERHAVWRLEVHEVRPRKLANVFELVDGEQALKTRLEKRPTDPLRLVLVPERPVPADVWSETPVPIAA